MTFAITEEQRLLSESLCRLLAETNEFEARRRRLRAADPDRTALWPPLAEMGVIGAAFDEAHGGFAGDPRTMAVILSDLGVSLAVEPFLASAVIAGRILQQWTAPAAAELIASVIGGDTICVLAHDAGSNPFAEPSTLAQVSGNDIVLSGALRCVRHADVASSFLVTAKTGDTTGIYHVPRDTAGLSIQTYRLIDDAAAGDLHLDGLRLSQDAQLTFDQFAVTVLHDALEWGLLGLAAETSGIVGALNKATFSYLGTRKQFGVAIGSFQALQHRAADMFIAAEELTAAVESAIESLLSSAGAARSAALSTAKVIADVAGRRVGHEAIQMHGGMGVSDELNVSHYARRLVAIRAELGTADIHRLRFGELQ